MLETITMPKFYSNREVAEILGVQAATIRQVKSRKADELAGLWENSNPDGETVWSEEGLAKLSEFIHTDASKEFRSGALARRTQEAIAVNRSELNYDDSEISPRTGQETTAYTINEGRYSQLPEKIGGAIAGQMINDGAVERIDKTVVSTLLSHLNLGDIDIDALLKN